MSQTNDPKVHLLSDNTTDTGSNNVQYTSSTARWVQRTRRRHTTLVVSIACVVITSVLLAITLAITLSVSPNGDSDSGGQSNCITPDVCNSNILKYIDTSYDPCDDFYHYSCGNWLSANPLNGRSIWGTAYELIADNYKHISEYLAEPVHSSDPDAIKKSKYIYTACNDVNYIQAHYVQHLQEFIKNAGGWADIGIFPDKGWDINNDLADHYYDGSSAFFTSGVVPDDHNSSKPIIKVIQGGLTLSSQWYYNATGTDFLNLVKSIKLLLDRISINGSTGNTSSMAEEIAGYERLLALESVTDVELRNLSAVYNPMTLQQFSTLFNLDWVQYFNTISKNAGFMLNITNSTVVNVATPGYFQNISGLVFNSSIYNTTKNYARWQLLYSEYSKYAAFLNDGIKDILKTEFLLAQTTSQGCVQIVESSMPLAVTRPFVEEFITKEDIDKVNKSVDNILKAFNERLAKNDWLSEYSRDQCKDKVNAISRRIAYPDFIKSNSKLDEYYDKLTIISSDSYFKITTAVREFVIYQQLLQYMVQAVDRTQWLDSPTAVNAYYYPPFNQINILAGIMRVPFFASNWPPFLLYGALGTVVSHEITHGFDNNGRQYNKNGNRTKWWSNESITEFNEHAQCLVEQYDNYIIQGYKVNGEQTLGENIADNGGVHAAFQAYKDVMDQTGQDRQKTIDKHTLDQLFFVAFAQLWCAQYSDAALEILVQTDEHSPDPVRVLGTLVNNEEFAAAFKCQNGSRMNPVKKCQLW